MKKTNMLKKNYEFKYVFSKGKYYGGEIIEIFLLKNNPKNNKKIFSEKSSKFVAEVDQKADFPNKIGIAISKKTGKSVVRNKIKRLIRENYRQAENNIKKGNTIVFLFKKNIDIKKATYYNIKKDMENIFKKANILISEKI